MMNNHKTRILLIAVGLVVCCLIWIPNLYDKFMMARFVAVATGLAIVFLCALIGKQRWVVPHTPVFYVYLLFVLLGGCSILWATNTAEAVFAFACLLLSPLVIIVFYNLLTTHRHLTQKVLWGCAAVILSVYLLFTVIQLVYIESFSFEQLYRVIGLNGHKNLLAAMLFVLSAFLLTSFSVFAGKFPKVLSVLLFIFAVIVIILLKSRAVLLSMLVAAGFFGVMVLLRVRHCEEERRSNLGTKPMSKNEVKACHETSSLDCFVPRNDAKRQINSPWPPLRGGNAKRGLVITLTTSIIIVYAFLTVGLRWFAERSVPHSTEKSEVETKMLSTSSLVERCLLWDKTYCIVDQHPVAGCGIGNWQIHFPDAGLKGLYRADVWNINFTKPHNEYLGLLAETGYFGLLLYVVFLTSLIVLSCFALFKAPNRKDFLYGTLVLSLFIGSCVNALFDFPNSRIEHILWMGILMAYLLQMITPNQKKTLNAGGNYVLLIVSLMLVTVGVFRLKGDRHSFEMQQALKANEWKLVKHHCLQAASVLYTIDPAGLPVHWYQGKAEKQMGNPHYLFCFRKAQRYAPYCKENLNDLGLAEYYVAHNLDKAEHALKEAIRISPNYLYPYLNLAYIYLTENEPQKAQEVAEGIYYDEHKREVMKADAVFFEPFSTEAAQRKIDADYQAVMQLHQAVSNKLHADPRRSSLRTQ